MKKTRITLLRLYRSTAVRLVLLAFVVYNANLRAITSFDTNPTRHLPFSIIKEFNLDLDEFAFLHKYPELKLHQQAKLELTSDRKDELPGYLRLVRGHYMSTYPVMTAILSLPVYLIPTIFGLHDGSFSVLGLKQTEVVGTALSKISGSLAIAISVGILYLTLLRLTSKRSALWLSILYGFATSTWSVSSQGLWTTTMSQTCLTFAFYFLVKAKENQNNVIYASIPLALSVACRPTSLIFALVLLIYVIQKYRSYLIEFLIFPTLLGTLLLTYNFYYFGDAAGGYYVILGGKTTPQRFVRTNETTDQTHSDFNFRIKLDTKNTKAFLGLLLSPSRGLLIYSPFLIFAFMGLAVAFYRNDNTLLTYIGIATMLIILLYSTWRHWNAGFGYSYRFLVELLPGLTLLLTVLYESILKKTLITFLFIILVGFSVLTQIVGAFNYPCGWHEYPADPPYSKRVWDWKDPEFLRCLKAGPVKSEGLILLNKLIKK